ncbi:hypothetical protein QA640_38950 [Bradyrhizobium sp. CB82]|uniref:hypothetical protein n=1 Tax=Bradyrhizobium sp. CB82 TaxID=3039159 RepID=UPI0024B27559|nr:hypothetical protein [Bradyrhizobium sp. CB82]WFU40132.1 hypothetical protein QA640_38950 [Bradyrhizobium sp. CB82]
MAVRRVGVTINPGSSEKIGSNSLARIVMRIVKSDKGTHFKRELRASFYESLGIICNPVMTQKQAHENVDEDLQLRRRVSFVEILRETGERRRSSAPVANK